MHSTGSKPFGGRCRSWACRLPTTTTSPSISTADSCWTYPACHGPSNDGALGELEDEATTDVQQKLCSYVRSTWVDSTVWPASSLSVFRRRIRTNNDVEGWHRRLNVKAVRGQLNLYMLIDLLAAEASLVDHEVRLLKESALIRWQRGSFVTATARLFRIWNRLATKERNIRQTLRAAAHVMVAAH